MSVPARHARAGRRGPLRLALISIGVVLVVVAASVAGLFLWARWQLSQVPTFAAAGPTVTDSAGHTTAAAAAPLTLPPSLDGVTTFLVFTTGSHNMTPAQAKKYNIPDYVARGTDDLTDSIILAVLDAPARKLTMLSIPRDTWLSYRNARINETYIRYGAAALASDVTRLTGVPINHMVAVNFTAAAELTDVVGGVNVQIPVPMKDTYSHLLLPQAGCIHMDGKVALAFARSRHTETYVNGQWQTDPSASDFGRSTRQQAIITAALDKLLSPKLPLYLPGLAATAKDTLIIDSGLNLGALFDVAKVLATGPHLQITHLGLPSRTGWEGAASVVFTDPQAAAGVLGPLVHEVPGASWPQWMTDAGVPEPGLSSATPPASSASPTESATPSGTPSSPSATSVVGTNSVVTVDGFSTGPNTDYRPCSNGITPPPQPY